LVVPPINWLVLAKGWLKVFPSQFLYWIVWVERIANPGPNLGLGFPWAFGNFGWEKGLGTLGPFVGRRNWGRYYLGLRFPLSAGFSGGFWANWFLDWGL